MARGTNTSQKYGPLVLLAFLLVISTLALWSMTRARNSPSNSVDANVIDIACYKFCQRYWMVNCKDAFITAYQEGASRGYTGFKTSALRYRDNNVYYMFCFYKDAPEEFMCIDVDARTRKILRVEVNKLI